MIKANINSELLSWAREQASLTREEAAEKIELKPLKDLSAVDILKKWENGQDRPTRNQLEKIAKAYWQSVYVFYLDTPPSLSFDIVDFRTIGDQENSTLSPKLSAIIRRLLGQQSEIKYLLEQQIPPAKPLSWVGQHTIQTPIETIIAELKQHLGLTEEKRKSSQTELLKHLREKIEQMGVFVLFAGDLGSYHSKIDVDEFRGIALSDTQAPFILINSNDAKAAQIFTMLHELAHIAFGQSSLSNFSYLNTQTSHKDIETVCNRIAAEILLPEQDILQEWNTHKTKPFEDAINTIASLFSVSPIASARRLLNLGQISKERYWNFYEEQKKLWEESKKKQKEKPGGPSYLAVKQYSLGKKMIHTVLKALKKEEITYIHAHRILGIKTRHFDSLQKDID